MLTGVKSKTDIVATHEAAPNMPITILAPPAGVTNDASFCSDNNVKIIMLGNPTYLIAVKAIHDALKFLRDGGDAGELKGKQADPELARQIIRLDALWIWKREYMTCLTGRETPWMSGTSAKFPIPMCRSMCSITRRRCARACPTATATPAWPPICSRNASTNSCCATSAV